MLFIDTENYTFEITAIGANMLRIHPELPQAHDTAKNNVLLYWQN